MKREPTGPWSGKVACEEIHERVMEGYCRDRDVGSREVLARRQHTGRLCGATWKSPEEKAASTQERKGPLKCMLEPLLSVMVVWALSGLRKVGHLAESKFY